MAAADAAAATAALPARLWLNKRSCECVRFMRKSSIRSYSSYTSSRHSEMHSLHHAGDTDDEVKNTFVHARQIHCHTIDSVWLPVLSLFFRCVQRPRWQLQPPQMGNNFAGYTGNSDDCVLLEGSTSAVCHGFFRCISMRLAVQMYCYRKRMLCWLLLSMPGLIHGMPPPCH